MQKSFFNRNVTSRLPWFLFGKACWDDEIWRIVEYLRPLIAWTCPSLSPCCLEKVYSHDKWDQFPLNHLKSSQILGGREYSISFSTNPFRHWHTRIFFLAALLPSSMQLCNTWKEVSNGKITGSWTWWRCWTQKEWVEHLTFSQQTGTSWWFQPIGKICSSTWESSPNFRGENKTIFETTT